MKMESDQRKMEYRFIEKMSLTGSAICELYGSASVSLKSNHFYRARHPLATFKRLSFSGFDYTSSAYAENVSYLVDEPRDSLIFHIPESGGLEIGLTRGQSISSLGPLAFPTPACRAASFGAHRREHRIAIDREHFLNLTPESVAVKAIGPLKFQQVPDIGNLADVLKSLIQTSYRTFSSEEVAMDLKLHAMGDMICSALLNFWPNSFSDALNTEERRIVPRQVKLAMDLIEADPFAFYPVHEIAQRCGVSVRALQYGFKNFVSCSIRDFIFERRVKQIREAAVDPANMIILKDKVGINLLRSINTLQEKYTGMPAAPWGLIDAEY